MQIQARNERDAGKRILCEGQIYVVAPGGALCRDGETEPADVDSRAAEKLLQNVKAWEPYGTPRGRAPQGRPPGVGIQLIDKHGNVLEREGTKFESPGPEAAEPPAELEQKTPPPILPPPPVAEPAEFKECSPSPGDTGAGEAPSEPAEDPPISAEGEEWADPKPTYSMQWLRACAKAYQVRYGPRSSAETLCANITAAMYDDGGDSEEQET